MLLTVYKTANLIVLYNKNLQLRDYMPFSCIMQSIHPEKGIAVFSHDLFFQTTKRDHYFPRL
jgi:hypothetical protein